MLTLARKKDPEALMSSQRTTTTFCSRSRVPPWSARVERCRGGVGRVRTWPLRICLATMEARRPRR